MHGNARCCAARTAGQSTEEDVSKIVSGRRNGQPAHGADVKPIEHLWDKPKRRVGGGNPSSTTIDELKIALIVEWSGIPRDSVKTLIRSRKKRMQAVVKTRGGNTKY